MLGALIYYIYSNGIDMLDSNFIWKSIEFQTCDDHLLQHLVTSMTNANELIRPRMHCLCHHPYFWSCEKILNFFIDVSNRVEFHDQGALRAISCLHDSSFDVILNGNWFRQLDVAVSNALPDGYRLNYDFYMVDDLLKAIRNKKNHYNEMPDDAKEILGPLPDRYTTYWINKFPRLLLHVYHKWYASGLYSEENFKQFYPNKGCVI